MPNTQTIESYGMARHPMPPNVPKIENEDDFQKWYRQWANITDLSPDPDDPKHYYDYRAAYKSGAVPTYDKGSNEWHWPSEFKKVGHPNLIVNGLDTRKMTPASKSEDPWAEFEPILQKIQVDESNQPSKMEVPQNPWAEFYPEEKKIIEPQTGAEKKPFTFRRLASQTGRAISQGFADIDRFVQATRENWNRTLIEGAQSKNPTDRYITQLLAARDPYHFSKDPKELTAKLKEKGIKIAESHEAFQALFPEMLEGTSGRIEQAVSGMARFLPTMAVSAASPEAGVMMTFSQIAGTKMDEYEKAGIPKERAFDAAIMSSIAQTPIEFAGNLFQIGALRHLARAFKVKGVGLGRIMDFCGDVLKGIGGEGMEEFLQQFPDEVANIWAANPDLTSKELIAEVNRQMPQIKENAKEALKVGGLGGGLLAGTGGIIISPFAASQYISDKQRSINEASAGPGAVQGRKPPASDSAPPPADLFTSEQTKTILDQIRKDHADGNLTTEDLKILKGKVNPDVAKTIDEILGSIAAETEVIDLIEPLGPLTKSARESAEILEEEAKLTEELTKGPGALDALNQKRTPKSAEEAERFNKSPAAQQALRERLGEEEKISRSSGIGGLSGYIHQILGMVEHGEPGQRIRIKDEFGPGEEWIGYSSTYPEFMKNRYGAKEVIKAIKKGLSGHVFNEKREVRQAQIWEDVLDFSKEMRHNDALKYAEMVEQDPELIGDFSDQEYSDMLREVRDEGLSTRPIEEAAYRYRGEIQQRALEAIARNTRFSEQELAQIIEEEQISLSQIFDEAVGTHLFEEEQGYDQETERRMARLEREGEEPGRPIQEQERGREEVEPSRALQAQEEIEPETTISNLVRQAADEAETEPTEAQIQANNYRHGHLKLHGLDISIENPKGSVRKGVDKAGKFWESTLKADYGYIRRTEGEDGDQVDVFIGPNPESETVYVIDQVDPDTKEFDEHKVMLGYETEKKARVGYLANYQRAWKGLGAIREMSMDDFKEWLKKPSEPLQAPEKGKKEVKPKEPWEMTKNEWRSEPRKLIKKGGGTYLWEWRDTGSSQDNRFMYQHQKAVKQALSEGLPVPEEVLKDYPELAKKETEKPELLNIIEKYQITHGKRYRLENGWFIDGAKSSQYEYVPGMKYSIWEPGASKTGSAANRGTAGTLKEAIKLASEAQKSRKGLQPPAREGQIATGTAKRERARGKIEDFGEKIGGARKDYYAEFADLMKKAEEVDITTEPLSKSWPEPNYTKLIEAGTDSWMVAFVRAARDEVPTKPKVRWKQDRWVRTAKYLRDFANDLLSGKISKERVLEVLSKDEYLNLRNSVGSRADLYEAVGHEKSLKGIQIASSRYSMYEGKEYDPPKILWTVERSAKKSAFSNWPRILAKGNSREEAIKAFKKAWPKLSTEKKVTAVQFNLYSKRGDKGVWIGKKIGRDYVDLEHFEDAKQARAYLKENQSALEEKLAQYKTIPAERRAVNRERIGKDHREGKDVTPEMFTKAFGFRGVEFGNWVINKERQDALNRAYDALMDLSFVLDIPSQAISLNGELGLAFGARGRGGERAPAAHYEPSKIVINLTRKKGPGTLAHEWWHALDNYFSRRRGEKEGYISEKAKKLREDPTRIEILNSLKAVNESIDKTQLKMRARELDKRRTKEYWGTGREMTARVFENYVIERLAQTDSLNDYLANIERPENYGLEMLAGFLDGKTVQDLYPYLLDNEIEQVAGAFDSFFKTVQTRKTEKGVMLYSGLPVDLLIAEVKKLPSVGKTIQAKAPELYEDLILKGTDIIKKGHATYEAFAKQMKSLLSEIWEKLRKVMMPIWQEAKRRLKDETGAIDLSKPKQPRAEGWADEYIRNALEKGRQEAKEKAINPEQVENNPNDNETIKSAYNRSAEDMIDPYIKDNKIDTDKFRQDSGIQLPTDNPKDLYKWVRRFQTMQDLAKNYPEMSKLLDIEQQRRGSRSQMGIRDREKTEAYFSLKKNNQIKVNQALIHGDKIGRNISNQQLEEDFGLNENERKGYWAIRGVLNDKLETILSNMIGDITELNQQVDNEAVIKAINKRNNLFIRTIDKGKRNTATSTMKKELEQAGLGKGQMDLFADKSQIEIAVKLADWAFDKRAYVPHSWKSGWRVKVWDKDGKEYLFDVPTITGRIGFTRASREKHAEKAAKQVVIEYLGEGNVDKWKLIRSRQTPVEISEAGSVPLMESILEAATSKVASQFEKDLPKEQRLEITNLKEQIHKTLEQLYLAKGWGRHLLGRKGIAGYREDLENVIPEYLSGFNGYITKGQAAKEFTAAMRDINPTKTPEMWRHGKEFVADMLGPSAGEARAYKRLVSLYFLAGDVSAAALNMTQNWTHAVALLREIELPKGGPIAEKEIAMAMRVIQQEYFHTKAKKGKLFLQGKTKHLSQDETGALRKALEQGQLDPIMFGERTGLVENKIHMSYLQEGERLLYAMFTGSESWNRMSTFLAAYRRAKRAKYDDPYQTAVDVMQGAHFIYGKQNRPEIVRKTGTLGNMAFTFMTYPMNNLTFLKNRIENTIKAETPQERKTALKVLASNFGYVAALGGLNALPFMFLFKLLWKAFEDDPDKDPEKLIRQHTSKPVGRAITRGIPSVFGNDMSWRVEGTDILDIPIGFQTMKTIKGRWEKGSRLWDQHDYWSAIFHAAPDMAMNPYKAVLGYYEGGERKNVPPIKYTAAEAAWKAFGFSPTREAETYKASELAREKREKRLNKINGWIERYLVAHRKKDSDAIAQIKSEIEEYNETEMGKGAAGIAISWPKDIIGGAKSRSKYREKGYDESLPEYMRQYQKTTKEAFKIQ